jgi:hypothetical protein
MPAKRSEARFNKNKNLTLYYYRHSMFTLMKSGSSLDLSQEIDFDTLDLTDVKFSSGQAVEILDSKYVPWINNRGPYTVKTELDECLQFSDNRPNPKEEWVLSSRG